MPRFQGLRAVEERVLLCFSGLRVKKVFFPKILAAARRYSPPPEPDSLAEAQRHSTRPDVTRRGPSHLRSPCNSLRPYSPSVAAAARHHSQRTASFAPARVTRRGPQSIAAARFIRSGLQSITLHGPPHLPQPESLA